MFCFDNTIYFFTANILISHKICSETYLNWLFPALTFPLLTSVMHIKNCILKFKKSAENNPGNGSKDCRYSLLQLYFPPQSHLSVNLQWDSNAMIRALWKCYYPSSSPNSFNPQLERQRSACCCSEIMGFGLSVWCEVLRKQKSGSVMSCAQYEL